VGFPPDFQMPVFQKGDIVDTLAEQFIPRLGKIVRKFSMQFEIHVE
jgi:hypothetical protein